MAELSTEVKVLEDPNRARESIQAQWWLDEGDGMAQSVWGVVRQIHDKQRGLLAQSLVWASLYENLARVGTSPGLLPVSVGQVTPSGALSTTSPGANRLTFNVIKSCVDTAAAKISKNKPRAKFATTDGNHAQQQRAKKLTQYLDGLFYASDAYRMGQRAFKWACVFGTGTLYVYVEPGTTNIKLRNVLAPDLTVDEVDGLDGRPRTLYYRHYEPRHELAELYPDKADAIYHAPADAGMSRSASDSILVVEAWHLKSSHNGTPGKHAVTIDGACLSEDEWDKDYFPFVHYRWTERAAGFWGMGLAEELAGIQLSINKLLRMISTGIEFMCVPRVFVQEGSTTSKHKLFDFGVIEFRGDPPIFNTAPAMPAEVYALLENLVNKAYSITGISQLNASGQKPAGVNAGVAMREYNDIATERFAVQGMHYEWMFLELAKIMLDLSRDLYKNNPKLKVNAPGKKFMQTINWADVDLEADKYVTECFPVSRLPIEPSERLQYVQELAQAGLADRDSILELLDIPDIEGYMAQHNAPYEVSMKLIDSILEKGILIEPEPIENLALTMRLAQLAYLRARCDDAPGDRLDMLRDFMSKCKALMPQAAPSSPAAPLAVPQAPPQSDLLPNVPNQATA